MTTVSGKLPDATPASMVLTKTPEGWRPGDIVNVNGMICVLEYVTLPGEKLPRLQPRPHVTKLMTRNQRRQRAKLMKKRGKP